MSREVVTDTNIARQVAQGIDAVFAAGIPDSQPTVNRPLQVVVATGSALTLAALGLVMTENAAAQSATGTPAPKPSETPTPTRTATSTPAPECKNMGLIIKDMPEGSSALITTGGQDPTPLATAIARNGVANVRGLNLACDRKDDQTKLNARRVEIMVDRDQKHRVVDLVDGLLREVSAKNGLLNTPTATSSPTRTETRTPTSTPTVTETGTVTPTRTETRTPTETRVVTGTREPNATRTDRRTPTPKSGNELPGGQDPEDMSDGDKVTEFLGDHWYSKVAGFAVDHYYIAGALALGLLIGVRLWGLWGTVRKTYGTVAGGVGLVGKGFTGYRNYRARQAAQQQTQQQAQAATQRAQAQAAAAFGGQQQNPQGGPGGNP